MHDRLNLRGETFVVDVAPYHGETRRILRHEGTGTIIGAVGPDLTVRAPSPNQSRRLRMMAGAWLTDYELEARIRRLKVRA